MSVLLWPRQEVLQLMIPQLGTVGKPLTAELAINLAGKLIQHQNPDGKISFDKWLIVSRDLMKWNDECIHIFWEMLTMATFYIHNDLVCPDVEEFFPIEMEYVLIFFILHIGDPLSPRPLSPTNSSTIVGGFNSVWPPVNPDPEMNVSPVSSPTRPSNQKKFSPRSTPISPRSPRNSRHNQNSSSTTPNSPRSAAAAAARTPRSNTQYLHSVKHKLPLILRTLNYDLDIQEATDLSEKERRERDLLKISNFSVDKKIVDALGLIVCGGPTREQSVPQVSSLIPKWNMDPVGSPTRHKSQKEFLDAFAADDGDEDSVLFSDVTSWLDIHLSMNDILYPVSSAPSFPAGAAGATNSPGGLTPKDNGTIKIPGSLDTENVKDPKGHQTPIRVLTPISTLSRFTPTVINNCSTTVIHVVTSVSGRFSSFRKLSSRSMESMTSNSDRMEYLVPSLQLQPTNNNNNNTTNNSSSGSNLSLVDSVLDDLLSSNPSGFIGSPKKSPGGSSAGSPYMHKHLSFSDVDIDSDKHDLTSYLSQKERGPPLNNALNRPDYVLPQLFLNFCDHAHLYMICPYYSATINGCSDCHIVVGAVYGALTISGCERVKITASCRKLIVVNCVECSFNIATLSTTVISGDSRSLVFGPYNTTYLNLKNHLKLAALQPLISAPIQSQNNSFTTIGNSPQTKNSSHYQYTTNRWFNLCDINACVHSPQKSNSPTGYAVDAASGRGTNSALTRPSTTVADFQAKDSISITSIPYKPEYLSPDYLVIPLPADYEEGMKVQRQTIQEIRTQVADLIPTVLAADRLNNILNESNSNEELDPNKKKETVKTIISSTLTKAFMEWLVASNNAQHIMDLVRLDAEKQSTSSHQ